MIRQNTGGSRNFVKFACAFLVAGWGASSPQAGGADPIGATISTESPIVSIAFAKCSKPLCKLEDDLTISLNVPQSLPADTPVPKMKAVIGAHLIRAADWDTAHEIELPAGDLRPAIGAVKNERLISLATFIGEWKDSPLLDALAKADSSEIPVTLTALDANGEPQGTRGFFRFDAASYFEANRVPLKITAVKCKGLTNRCQLARTHT